MSDRRCYSCGVELRDYVNFRPGTHQKRCWDCRNAYYRAYRAKNPEKIREIKRRSEAKELASNPDAKRERARRWYENNPEKVEAMRERAKARRQAKKPPGA